MNKVISKEQAQNAEAYQIAANMSSEERASMIKAAIMFDAKNHNTKYLSLFYSKGLDDDDYYFDMMLNLMQGTCEMDEAGYIYVTDETCKKAQENKDMFLDMTLDQLKEMTGGWTREKIELTFNHLQEKGIIDNHISWEEAI